MKYKIYIPHYTKLIDRKKDLIEQLKIHSLNDYIFFEKYDKENININEFTDDEVEIVSRIRKFIPINVINQFLQDRLNNAEKSIALKHKYIFEDYLNNNKNNVNLLVLEDDVVLTSNFVQLVNTIDIQKYKCVLLGAGASMKKENIITIDNFNLRKTMYHPFSNGLEAYYMSYDLVEYIFKILKNKKLCIPIDWELSNIFMDSNIAAYHTQPYFCYQGSVIGKYKSSIRENRTGYL